MSLELITPTAYRRVAALLRSSPRPLHRWSLRDGDTPLARGMGQPQPQLLGVSLPARLLEESASYGYAVQSGQVTQNASGELVLEASDTAGAVSALRLPLWGTQHLFERVVLEVSASASAPINTGVADTGTRIGIRHYSAGSGGAYAEALLSYLSGAWRLAMHVTDGTNHSRTTGDAIDIADLVSFQHRMVTLQDGSINYPKFYAEGGTLMGDVQVGMAGLWGTFSGYNFTTTPEQGGYWEIYAAQSGAGGGGDSVTLSIQSLEVRMATGTSFVEP